MGLKITPKGKFVYCQLDSVGEKKTDGGIYLPDNHSEGTRLAKVISKGKDVSPEVDVGSIWAVQWHAGTALHFVASGILDDTMRIMSESELMARVEETDDGNS